MRSGNSNCYILFRLAIIRLRRHMTTISDLVELGLFRYNNFRLGGGLNIEQYKVTEFQTVGNFKNSNYTSWYVNISYEYRVTDQISLNPDIGYGVATVDQRTSSKSFGRQDGTEFRLGMTGAFHFTEFSSVFIGIHYVNAALDINTAPAYKDYFGKMNQVQLAIGLQFD